MATSTSIFVTTADDFLPSTGNKCEASKLLIGSCLLVNKLPGYWDSRTKTNDEASLLRSSQDLLTPSTTARASLCPFDTIAVDSKYSALPVVLSWAEVSKGCVYIYTSMCVSLCMHARAVYPWEYFEIFKWLNLKVDTLEARSGAWLPLVAKVNVWHDILFTLHRSSAQF